MKFECKNCDKFFSCKIFNQQAIVENCVFYQQGREKVQDVKRKIEKKNG